MFPQSIRSIHHETTFANNPIRKYLGNKIPDHIRMDDPILERDAKLTDLISTMNFRPGHVISSTIRNIIFSENMHDFQLHELWLHVKEKAFNIGTYIRIILEMI